jgi:hypothetical protein
VLLEKKSKEPKPFEIAEENNGGGRGNVAGGGGGGADFLNMGLKLGQRA